MHNNSYLTSPLEVIKEIERMCIDTFGYFNHRRFEEIKRKYLETVELEKTVISQEEVSTIKAIFFPNVDEKYVAKGLIQYKKHGCPNGEEPAQWLSKCIIAETIEDVLLSKEGN